MGVIILIVLILLIAIAMNIAEVKDKLAKLNRRSKIRRPKKRGALKMSKIIASLVGKRCKISDVTVMNSYECSILEVDEEWIKLEVYNRKNNEVLIKRIDAIEDILIIDNDEIE